MATNADDVIRVIAGYAYVAGGKPMSNVFHFADTGGGGILDVDFVNGIGTIMEAILQEIHDIQSLAFRYVNIQVQNLTQNLIIGTFPWPTFGAGAGSALNNPSQVCGLVRMITARPRVQGRVFIAGTTESTTGDSAYTGAVQTAMADLGVNLLAPRALGIGELTYCVFNQVLKTFLLPNSTAFGISTRGLNRRKLA